MILKNPEKIILVISALVLVFTIPIVYATELQISTTVSGGGTSTSTSYNADMTIADNIAGTTTSTSYILNAGFLPVHSVNLTPVVTTDDDDDTSAPSTPSGGSSGGGGGGGSSGGSSGQGVRGGGSSEVQLYEISWNLCNSNIIRVLAGPASVDLGVKIRTSQSGIVPAHLASEQPYEDILKFEANISQTESFVLVQAESIVGRSTQIDKQTINLDPCGGRVVVREYTPTESDVVIQAPKVDYKPLPQPAPEIPVPAPFIDTTKDPQYYIDRYNTEPAYKSWFDRNYSQYTSIYHAVGLEESDSIKTEPEPTVARPGTEIPIPAPFVDPVKDPQYYIDRYYNEPAYKSWFDRNYPNLTIEEAVLIQKNTGITKFVDPTQDPQYYIDRYYNEPEYKSWFDRNYPEYTIEDAVKYGSEQETGLLADFVDPVKDPQYYIDRYYNEPAYKSWFDRNYPHLTIEDTVLIKTRIGIADFVDSTKDPQYYINRYNTEPAYKSWFDMNYPEYDSIYNAVGVDKIKYIEESEPLEPEFLEIISQIVLGLVVIVTILVISFFVYGKIINRGGVRIGGIRWE